MALVALPDGTYIDDASQVPQPAPTELANWNNQRRQFADAYGAANAQNTFDRGQQLSQQSYDTQQLAQKWDRMRETLPGQYANRGLLNSGIYGGALQRYGQDRNAASSGLALQYQNSLGQLGLAGQRAQNTYTSGTAGVDATEQARRQELAATLKGVV